jgi:hypothetical protein
VKHPKVGQHNSPQGITFGIISNGENPEFLDTIISSIIWEVPLYEWEIIVVYDDHVKVSQTWAQTSTNGGFYPIWNIDNSTTFLTKAGHITAKKNHITKLAKYDNIVYMHDYLHLCEGWHEGFLKFNEENPVWDLSINIIINLDGSRFRDWCSWGDPRNPPGFWQLEQFCPQGLYHEGTPALMPYDDPNPLWYISGAYWIGKKDFMLKNPLDESLVHLGGEDVEFSLRVRNKAIYKMNPYSSVKLLKKKDVVLKEFK